MSVVANVITPQGLEPFQIPTKIRSPSGVSGYETVTSSFLAVQMPSGGTFNPSFSGFVTLPCTAGKSVLGGVAA